MAEIGIEDLALAVRANPGNRIVVGFRVSLLAGLDGIQPDQNTEFGTVVSLVLVNFIGKGKFLLLESLIDGMLDAFHEEGPLASRVPRVPGKATTDHIGVFLPLRHASVRSGMKTGKGLAGLDKAQYRVTLSLFGKAFCTCVQLLKMIMSYFARPSFVNSVVSK